MNLYINQEHQNSSISLTNVFQLKTSCYLSKIILKSNCKHIPTDGVVRTKTSARYANVLLTGELTGKNVTGTIKSFKKDQKL